MRSPLIRPRALVELTLVRVREFVREPEALFWGLAFPVLLAGSLGIAFRSQAPEASRIAVVSGDLAATLEADPSLRVVRLEPEAARRELQAGRVSLVVEPAPGGGVVYRYDDTNPEGRAARTATDRAVQVAAGRVDPVGVTDDVARDAGSRYIDFLIPGLVGLGIMGNSIWNLGFGIVDARRRRLMKRLVATPMPRDHYLLSFLLWRILLLPIEVGVPVLFGAVAFGVPVRGSIVDLVAVCALGSLAFSALGLLIASRAKTIEAASGIMNLVMVPMWILSGVFFSSQRFPDVLQPAIHALPLTALNDAVRAIMLQGAGLADLHQPMIALGVCLVMSFVLALRLFRWR